MRCGVCPLIYRCNIYLVIHNVYTILNGAVMAYELVDMIRNPGDETQEVVDALETPADGIESLKSVNASTLITFFCGRVFLQIVIAILIIGDIFAALKVTCCCCCKLNTVITTFFMIWASISSFLKNLAVMVYSLLLTYEVGLALVFHISGSRKTALILAVMFLVFDFVDILILIKAFKKGVKDIPRNAGAVSTYVQDQLSFIHVPLRYS